MRKINFFPRIVAGGVAAGLVFTQVAGLYAGEGTLWDERRALSRRHSFDSLLAKRPTATTGPSFPFSIAPQPDSFTTRPSGIGGSLSFNVPQCLRGLPESVAPFGDIREIHWAGAKAPLVFHIQDIHDVEEAQRNMAGLVGALLKREGVHWVGLEGAAGPLPQWEDLRRLSNRPVTEALLNLALKLGYIGGAELAAFQAPQARLWGTEKAPLYVDHLAAFEKSEKTRAEDAVHLARLSSVSDIALDRWYGPRLKNFEARRAAYAEGRDSLAPWLAFLWPFRAPGAHISLARLHAVLTAESALDFKGVELERQALAESLARALPPAALNELINISVGYRMGRFPFSMMGNALEVSCRRAGVRLDQYPRLKSYLSYLDIAESVDLSQALVELEELEIRMEESLCGRSEERRIARIRRSIRCLDRLVHHRMTPADWRAYETHPPDSIQLTRQLSDLIQQPVPELTLAGRAHYEAYAVLALQRNRGMVDNLLAKIRTEGASTGLLIAGGFHTEGMTRILKEAGVSYVVLTPRIAGDFGPSRVLEPLIRAPLPMEKLLSGAVTQLASPRLAGQIPKCGEKAPSVAARVEAQKNNLGDLLTGLHTLHRILGERTESEDSDAILKALRLQGWGSLSLSQEPLAFPKDSRLTGLLFTTERNPSENGSPTQRSAWALVGAEAADSKDPFRAVGLEEPVEEIRYIAEGKAYIVRLYAAETVSSLASDSPWLRLTKETAEEGVGFLSRIFGGGRIPPSTSQYQNGSDRTAAVRSWVGGLNQLLQLILNAWRSIRNFYVQDAVAGRRASAGESRLNNRKEAPLLSSWAEPLERWMEGPFGLIFGPIRAAHLAAAPSGKRMAASSLQRRIDVLHFGTEYSHPGSLTAFGDMDADRPSFLALLRCAGVVDMNGHWIGGRRATIQVGDLIGRSGDNLKALRQALVLQYEARRAGGALVLLIGNHDLAVLTGKPIAGDFAYMQSWPVDKKTAHLNAVKTLLAEALVDGRLQVAAAIHGADGRWGLATHAGVRESFFRQLIENRLWEDWVGETPDADGKMRDPVSVAQFLNAQVVRWAQSLLSPDQHEYNAFPLLDQISGLLTGRSCGILSPVAKPADDGFAKGLFQLIGHTVGARPRFQDADGNVVNLDAENRSYTEIRSTGEIREISPVGDGAPRIYVLDPKTKGARPQGWGTRVYEMRRRIQPLVFFQKEAEEAGGLAQLVEVQQRFFAALETRPSVYGRAARARFHAQGLLVAIKHINRLKRLWQTDTADLSDSETRYDHEMVMKETVDLWARWQGKDGVSLLPLFLLADAAFASANTDSTAESPAQRPLDLGEGGATVAIKASPFVGVDEVVFRLGKNTVGAPALMSGVLAAHGLRVEAARFGSREDEFVGRFWVDGISDGDAPTQALSQRIWADWMDVMASPTIAEGFQRVERLFEQQGIPYEFAKGDPSSTVRSQVKVSQQGTVLSVWTVDRERQGLLHAITRFLAERGVELEAPAKPLIHVFTWGDLVMDSFRIQLPEGADSKKLSEDLRIFLDRPVLSAQDFNADDVVRSSSRQGLGLGLAAVGLSLAWGDPTGLTAVPLVTRYRRSRDASLGPLGDWISNLSAISAWARESLFRHRPGRPPGAGKGPGAPILTAVRATLIKGPAIPVAQFEVDASALRAAVLSQNNAAQRARRRLGEVLGKKDGWARESLRTDGLAMEVFEMLAKRHRSQDLTAEQRALEIALASTVLAGAEPSFMALEAWRGRLERHADAYNAVMGMRAEEPVFLDALLSDQRLAMDLAENATVDQWELARLRRVLAHLGGRTRPVDLFLPDGVVAADLFAAVGPALSRAVLFGQIRFFKKADFLGPDGLYSVSKYLSAAQPGRAPSALESTALFLHQPAEWRREQSLTGLATLLAYLPGGGVVDVTHLLQEELDRLGFIRVTA